MPENSGIVIPAPNETGIISAPNRRTFGVELEIIGASVLEAHEILTTAGVDATLFSDYSKWGVILDGSLKHYDCKCGVYQCKVHTAEVVSPILQGDKGLQQLQNVMSILSDNGCKTNLSCGTHVHVAGHFMRNNDSAKIRLLDRYVGLGLHKQAGRFNDDYALVLESQQAIRNYVVSKTINRYYAINLASLQLRGTVEFRQLAGTLDFTTLNKWLYAMMKLVEDVYEDTHNCSCGNNHESEKCSECGTRYCPEFGHYHYCDSCKKDVCPNSGHSTKFCYHCADMLCRDEALSQHGQICPKHPKEPYCHYCMWCE